MSDAAHFPNRARLIRLALLAGLSACGESSTSTEPPAVLGTATAIALLTPFSATAPMERKASDSLPSSLSVQLRDATGQPVKRAGRMLTLSVLEATGAVSTRIVIRRGEATPTDSAGVARVTNLVLGGRAGEAVVSAKIDSLPAVIFPVRLSAGALSRTSSAVALSLDSVPVGGVSQITVMPLDADGNKRGAGEQVTAALDGDQTLASVSTFTYQANDSSYRGTITVSAPSAPRALRVNVNGAALATTRQFTGIAAVTPPSPATALRMFTLPGDTVGGYRTLSGAVWSSTVVQLVDATGAAVRQAGVAVTGSATTTGGQALPNSSLTGANTTSTNAQGQAVFPGIALTAPAGSARLRFESGALTATGLPVLVTVGVASITRSTLTVSRDSLYVDSVSVITVIPRDAAGTALGAGSTVALSLTGGTSAGTLSTVAYSAIDSSYRAAFTAVTRGTGTTLRATVNGSELATTRVLTVIAQPGLVVASSPVTVVPDSVPVAGVSQFTATPLDGFGRKLGAGQTVSVALSGGSGVSVATVGTVTYSTTDSSYHAGITGVTVGTSATVTTTVNGVVLTTTRPLTVSSNAPPNTATALAITGGGVLVQSGAVMNSVTVALRNSSGGAVAQAGVSITATAVTSNGTTAWSGASITGGGPLSTDANGQIVFPALQLSAPVGSGRIKFSGPNLTAVSFPVRVSAGAFSAATTTFTLSADAVAVNAVSTAIVTPRDAIGNKLGSGQTVTFTLGSGTSGITIGATTFTPGDSTYRAALTGTAAGTARVVTASVGGIAVTQTRALTVNAASSSDITATVNGSSTFEISRYIYGGNGIEGAWDGATPPPEMTLNRQGGNRLTAYNWENNYSNAGKDYYYSNDSYLSSSTTPGQAVRNPATSAFSRGQAFMATIPMLGYVSADASGTVTTSDADRMNRLATHFRISKAAKGSAFTTSPNASDAFVYQDEFVNWFNTSFPGRGSHPSAPVFFSLDNEPDLWHDTHKEIQSDLNDNGATMRLQTYRGYSDTTVAYAKAIKSVMPDALIFGPAVGVWSGWEGLGRYPNADPDYGTQNFFDVYLDRMRAASASDGRRLIDVLDIHFYTEVKSGGVKLNEDDYTQTAASNQARMQSTRSLWDPTYNEASWVTDNLGGPIRLIPRLREQVAAHYPGTKLAITEYYYGRGGDISGGVAQADALGIFGREGLFAASIWPLGKVGAPPKYSSGTQAYAYIFGAFRVFRNYDGAGSAFGDTGLSATTSDVAQSSIYASRTAGGKTVLIVINKATTAKSISVTLSGVGSPTGAQVYMMANGTPNPTRQADVAVSGGVLTYIMPATSVSVLSLTP
jgi:Glycoside hydrolase family 44